MFKLVPCKFNAHKNTWDACKSAGSNVTVLGGENSAVPTSSQVMLDSCCLWDSPHTPKPGIELRAVHMLITSPTTELHPSPLWDTLNRKRCGNSDIAQAFHCREKERTGGHTEVTANHLMILRMKVGLIFWEFLPHSRPYFQLLPGKKGPFLF